MLGNLLISPSRVVANHAARTKEDASRPHQNGRLGAVLTSSTTRAALEGGRLFLLVPAILGVHVIHFIHAREKRS